MKHIRTKDGRIMTPLIEPDVFDNQELENAGILKIADAIEELCDWFATEDAFDSRCFGPILFNSVSLARLRAQKAKDKIVGYIVIEKKGVKTLEPVMKTNEEGEFELL